MINLSNTFLTSILLNHINIHRVVIAEDKQDAINTINDYYMEANINYLFSYEEIGNILEESLKKTELNFYLCIELTEDENKNTVYNSFYEYVNNIEELKIKYKNRFCFFYDSNYIHMLAHHAEAEFNHSQRKPLISENITL